MNQGIKPSSADIGIRKSRAAKSCPSAKPKRDVKLETKVSLLIAVRKKHCPKRRKARVSLFILPYINRSKLSLRFKINVENHLYKKFAKEM